MNEHSRSIDIRHHAIRQDYVDGLMRIGGVDTQDNTSDILTKFLQPPLHIKHTSHLHINNTNRVTNTHTSLQSHVTHATLKQHTSVGAQTSHHHRQKRNDTPRNQPKPKHNRRRGKQPQHIQTHTPHHAHTRMCPTHTPIQPKYRYPDSPYQTPDKWNTKHHPGPSQPSLPRNCEQTPKRRATNSNKNLSQKLKFPKPHQHTETHTKKSHKSCPRRKPSFATYTYLKPKICQNGHMFWVRAYTTVKYKKRHPEFCAHNPSDRIPNFSSSRCPHQHFGNTSSDRIRIPHPFSPTEPQPRMCSQPQFLHSPNQHFDINRTKMGPNTRIEAIRDTQSDILDSLKRLTKYTTELTSKKLYSMPCDVFDKKKAALPQYKRLCDRTIRVTMDGQLIAPRKSKHEYHYRLFEDFLDILRQESDRLLEIEETMESLRDLHEFRKQYKSKPVEPPQNEYSFKPVKNRPPTPGKILNLRELMERMPSPGSPPPGSPRSLTPLPVSPSGYSSSSSSSSESTTTTTLSRTTTVRHQWSDSDATSTSSSSPHPDRFY